MHIDQHPAGDFCWIELATTDQNAAKNFYGTLFGWSADDLPMGPDGFYTMFQIDGRAAAAAYTMGPHEHGIPPHWNLYMAVASADDAARKAASLGGKVLAEPFDVFTVGRMAVIQDPTGAAFCLWQAKSHVGITVAGVPGTFCWADLSTPDPARAKDFYSALFGWSITPGEKDSSGYLHIQNGEEFIGGIPPAQHRDPNAPPHWLIYIQVSDVDASAAKAKELGAKAYVPPMTIEGVGRMSVLADPQGAVFAIFTSARPM